MEPSSDEILSFATQIAFALSQPRGKNWTSREIDGCFYNHYLNPNLRQALRNIRLRHLGQEEPLWPSRFDSQGLPIEVRLSNQGLDRPRLVEILELQDMAEAFGVFYPYLHLSYRTGLPLPFSRYVSKIQTDSDYAPIFRLDIFNRRMANSDWRSIQRIYSHWNELMKSEESKALIENTLTRREQGLSNYVRHQFVENGVPHLETLAYPPFPSPNMFELIAKEHFEQEKDRLPGQGTAGIATRTWTAYLLTELVGTTQREAIIKTNEVLGKQFGTFTMNEYSEGIGGHSGGVTSSGEVQFSREKEALKKRIASYDSWLAQADPSWRFIN